MVKQSFVFAPPPPVTNSAPSHGGVALLRRLTVAAPFDTQSLTYRTGEFSYERDPYAEFLVPPERALSGPIREYLSGSGAFASVVEPGSAEKADKILEICIEELYGDFRKQAPPEAVLALRLACFDAAGGAAGKVLLQKRYSERVALRPRTAESLVAGLNEALKKVMSRAGSDLKQLAPKSASITP